MRDDQLHTYPQPPDLQQWIARYGGYLKIPWDEWDRAVETYENERRAYLGGPYTKKAV